MFDPNNELQQEMSSLSARSSKHQVSAEKAYERGDWRAAEVEAAMSTMYSNAVIMLQEALRMIVGR